ncbi:TPA: hypothetical protein ACMDO2_000707 [Vibrio parahaemolyticus]|uniref:hypothetical protein n=1 Tax=Vibrio parahaemolyticus TaxID=670 RepID=UPI001124B604|nr:hypothetical protein [Vibrio parahaemolyticus]EKA7379949.1 hypothetical protein [Vibrio parahaemolyticus]TOK17793.1 hypothetical protein CGI23_25085 [Vibrio parahaemolyticus]TPA19747.1 hypothetical protein DXJ84_25215 [Vibrio parahaemolyticus]HCG5245887.1 hypothetical protein [Vibrio parahaemolyticus]
MTAPFAVIDKHFSVVLLGQFNALHHLPENLLRMGLLNSDDAELTKIDIITPSDIQLELPWGHLRVEPTGPDSNRLSISLNDYSAYTLFRDFLVSIVNYNDTAAPYVMGFNHRFWVQHPTRNAWDNFGDCLTPKQSWLEVFEREGGRAGMNELSMKIDAILEPVFVSDQRAPELNISIKPVKHTPDGVEREFCTECGLNYHFRLGEVDSVQNTLNTIERYFDEIFHGGQPTITKLIEKFS